MKTPVIAAIAAIGRDRGLGYDNQLLWQIPDDLKRFKALSTGHPIILGRKTFESIVGYRRGPLPNRTNIVVTRDPSWRFDGVVVSNTVEDAIAKATAIDGEFISIGGGAQIYEAALPYTNRLYLTIIDDQKDADSFFPEYDKTFTKELFREEREWEGLKYAWVDLER